MCGRYTLIEWEELQSRFHVWADEPLRPRYNIAPTQKAAIITGTERRVELFRWGLIPFTLRDVGLFAFAGLWDISFSGNSVLQSSR